MKNTFAVYKRKATENGVPIFPKKFSLEALELLKKQLGTYEYSCNYENEPINSETQHFRPPVRYWTDLGEGAQHTLTVDLAISEKTSADYTVVLDMARTRSNQLCVVEYARRHMSPSETIEKIFEFIQKYKPRRIGIEAVAYQMAMISLMKEEMRKRNVMVDMVPIHHNRDKFTRIVALQPYWETGNLLLKQGMIELEDELFRFPVGEHDDVIDALSMQLGVSDPQYTNQSRVYIPERWKN